MYAYKKKKKDPILGATRMANIFDLHKLFHMAGYIFYDVQIFYLLCSRCCSKENEKTKAFDEYFDMKIWS